MHISDGVLSVSVLTGGYIAAGALCAWGSRQIKDEEIPRIAVFTAAFFAASFIHFKIPPTSVHLLFNGLLGVVLGRRALLALPIGLVLQVLLNNGGITVLGVNTCIFALPALASRFVFYWLYTKNEKWCFAAGALSGGLGVLLTGILMMLVLQTAGEGFLLVAEYVFLLHLPVMLVEAIVTGFTVVYLQRVQPLLLRETL